MSTKPLLDPLAVYPKQSQYNQMTKGLGTPATAMYCQESAHQNQRTDQIQRQSMPVLYPVL